MTDNKIFLTIVIPARNEEENIEYTIDSIIPFIDRDSTEIIVVNDHSSDRTEEIVKTILKKEPIVKLVSNVDEPGFANALKTGFRHAKGEFVLPVMADGCDHAETISLMLDKARDGYEIVCGCRYMKNGGKEGGPRLQGFFSKFVCLSLYYLTKIPTKDVSNAFKLYKRDILQKLHLKEKGFAISMEITLKSFFKGYKICDVPTFWSGRKKGKSKFKLSKTFPYVRLYLWALAKAMTK